MSHFINSLFSLFRPSLSQKGSQTGTSVAYHTVGKPVWTPRSYEALSYEGFQKNPIVYRCVSLIARSVASVRWQLHNAQGPVDAHPLLSLLQNPNPQQTQTSFLESVVSYLLLSGNSYIESISLPGHPIQELYALRPDRMQLIPSAKGQISSYVYRVDDQETFLPASSILHLKTFHPLNDWYGMSPVEAIAGSIDQHNAVSEHNLAVLQNGARPSGAFILNTQYQPYFTQQQREELGDFMENYMKGPHNGGRIMVMEGDFKWQDLGMKLKELDFIEGKKLSAREIAQAYGVPPMLVGVSGDSTYANYREARFHFWEDTILPLVEMIIESFNQWLAPRFDPSLKFLSHVDEIPALAPRREMTWDKVAKAPFLTTNEKRQAVGYGPLKKDRP